MTDRIATDILVHEWNGDECKHGCLCVHTIDTHNALCPNRVHDLQKRYAKVKSDCYQLWLKISGFSV